MGFIRDNEDFDNANPNYVPDLESALASARGDAMDFAMMIGRLAKGIRDLTVGTASPKARALADKADDLVKRKGYAPPITRKE
jgi:hypothetical protein